MASRIKLFEAQGGFLNTAVACVNAIATKRGLFWHGKKQLNKFRKHRDFCSSSTKSADKVDNNLIIISGICGKDTDLRVLIDPASQAEIISKEAAERIGTSIRDTSAKLVSAEGSELNVIGQTDVCLGIAGTDYNLNAQVVSTLSKFYDIILGIGFLNTTHTSLITEPGCTPKFLLEGRSIPLLKSKSRGDKRVFSIKNLSVDTVDYAKSAKYDVIAPRSVGFLKASIPANKDLIGKTVCFENLVGQQQAEATELFQLKEGIINPETVWLLTCHWAFGSCFLVLNSNLLTFSLPRLHRGSESQMFDCLVIIDDLLLVLSTIS